MALTLPRKVHIMNFWWRKYWYYQFLGIKGDLFQRRKLIERYFLSIYETCMILWELRQMFFQFSKKQWEIVFSGMEYHAYWLLKSSCFELFGDWKYGLFWPKTLMERWYLLITKKFLFWIFWRLEIRSFFDPKNWWKDVIYLVFLSFPWCSRTSEYFAAVNEISIRFNNQTELVYILLEMCLVVSVVSYRPLLTHFSDIDWF